MWRPQTFDVASVVNAFHERAESRLFLLQPELLYLLFDDAFDPRIKSKLPSRVPRLSGRRLEARRVLRKRATARNNVDRGIPSCARAASATSAVTFQPDCRNKSLSTAARRSTSGNGGSFGSTKPDDIASRYSRSTGRSIPFQVYKNGPPVPIWMPRKKASLR